MMEKKTVLLVDDVKLFLRLEETFFQRAGCLVLTADSGATALKLARERTPDLILLDYLMPDIKGDQVCRELKADERTSHIPIIIVSTSSKKEDIDLCFNAGCDDYVTKPINPEVVLAKAAQFLGVSQRLHKRLAVNFRIEGQAPPLTFTGFSRNLSRSGILIEADQKLEPGTMLKLWLPLAPDQTMVEFNGEIARAELEPKRGKYLYGIHFKLLAKDSEVALNNYLQRHLPEEQMQS